MATNFPEFIIVHTAASGANGSDFDVDAATVDRWHKQNGWRGIGYHYLIRKDGTVERGRAETERGAHCTHMGMNSRSIGICMSGHHNYTPWTPAQWSAFKLLAVDIMERYDIDVHNVLGHRETGSPKDCPGKLVNMVEVRDALYQELNEPEIDTLNEVTLEPIFQDHPQEPIPSSPLPGTLDVRVMVGGVMYQGAVKANP